MKSKLLGYLSAAVLGAAIALPTPAMAFRGGGGFGGMHGGFGGGGMTLTKVLPCGSRISPTLRHIFASQYS